MYTLEARVGISDDTSLFHFNLLDSVGGLDVKLCHEPCSCAPKHLSEATSYLSMHLGPNSLHTVGTSCIQLRIIGLLHLHILTV